MGEATPVPPSTPARGAPTATRVASKINLNTATLAELDALPGIGPSIGQRIIDYRTQNGDFKTIEEIKKVRGIGDALFNQIKDLITVQ
jgi:competence protein ComEA